MRGSPITAVVLTAVLFVAAPVTAQDEMAADTTEPTEEQMEEAVDEAEDAAEEATEADAPPSHDWEFTLAPNDNAPAGEGMVKVTEEDAGSSFVVEVTGLPAVDSLDSEQRDVNAYTVWVVPSRDQVAQSILAGVLDVDPEGAGTFEGTTDLDTFGIVVTATPDGAPERIGGIPVLTGIPVTSEPTAEDVEGEEPPTPEAEEPADAPAPDPEVGPDEEVDPEAPGAR